MRMGTFLRGAIFPRLWHLFRQEEAAVVRPRRRQGLFGVEDAAALARRHGRAPVLFRIAAAAAATALRALPLGDGPAASRSLLVSAVVGVAPRGVGGLHGLGDARDAPGHVEVEPVEHHADGRDAGEGEAYGEGELEGHDLGGAQGDARNLAEAGQYGGDGEGLEELVGDGAGQGHAERGRVDVPGQDGQDAGAHHGQPRVGPVQSDGGQAKDDGQQAEDGVGVAEVVLSRPGHDDAKDEDDYEHRRDDVGVHDADPLGGFARQRQVRRCHAGQDVAGGLETQGQREHGDEDYDGKDDCFGERLGFLDDKGDYLEVVDLDAIYGSVCVTVKSGLDSCAVDVIKVPAVLEVHGTVGDDLFDGVGDVLVKPEFGDGVAALDDVHYVDRDGTAADQTHADQHDAADTLALQQVQDGLGSVGDGVGVDDGRQVEARPGEDDVVTALQFRGSSVARVKQRPRGDGTVVDAGYVESFGELLGDELGSHHDTLAADALSEPGTGTAERVVEGDGLVGERGRDDGGAVHHGLDAAHHGDGVTGALEETPGEALHDVADLEPRERLLERAVDVKVHGQASTAAVEAAGHGLGEAEAKGAGHVGGRGALRRLNVAHAGVAQVEALGGAAADAVGEHACHLRQRLSAQELGDVEAVAQVEGLVGVEVAGHGVGQGEAECAHHVRGLGSGGRRGAGGIAHLQTLGGAGAQTVGKSKGYLSQALPAEERGDIEAAHVEALAGVEVASHGVGQAEAKGAHHVRGLGSGGRRGAGGVAHLQTLGGARTQSIGESQGYLGQALPAEDRGDVEAAHVEGGFSTFTHGAGDRVREPESQGPHGVYYLATTGGLQLGTVPEVQPLGGTVS
ncbi:hypothetical protein PgNI_06134 [Pyricularia grisea]|uniref:Uncharacterized protein n=1 Tax=Pyricularia grisea TaxID=148305 RepID=A0A6P8B7A7_PYRGI|nr:hypothetical protein PgNI_06134 [Pyricularia grisea]TLD11216.1 hypothetical protein PgNI_06134 [Pyricularia grisea]